MNRLTVLIFSILTYCVIGISLTGCKTVSSNGPPVTMNEVYGYNKGL